MEINNQENRNRKWSTEINGIPYNPNEDCYEIVEKIGKLILPDFNKNKFDICHRNKQAPNATTPTITCLFKNRTDKDIFFVNRKSLKDKSINDIGLKATPATDTTRNKIFINESLSAITKSIFRQARIECKRKHYYSCNTANGIIYCQHIKDGSKLRINSLLDCKKI